MNDQDARAPFWDHVEELRQTLIKILFMIISGGVICFVFYEQVFSVLCHPFADLQQGPPSQKLATQEVKRQRIINLGLKDASYKIPANAAAIEESSEGVRKLSPGHYSIEPNGRLEIESPASSMKLLLLNPTEGLASVLKICFWVALVGTSPLWSYFALQFIAPALKGREKLLILPFFFLSLLFLTAGFAFAYFVTLPLANRYLYAFNAAIGVNFWSLSGYIDYTLMILLANGLVFEFSLILFFLVHFGILTAAAMRKNRRWMAIASFVLGALLTPPDIPSQLMLALPLLALNELAILYAAYRHRQLHANRSLLIKMAQKQR